MTGPGDGWPPSWEDGADAAPWDWAPGGEEHAEPAGLPDEPDLSAPAEADHLPDPDRAVGGPDEPRGLPAEPPADWTTDGEPARWSDQPEAPYAAGGDDPFPPALDVGVTPADGGPWADPELLGADTPLPPPDPAGDPPAALRADLAAADGEPGADWAALRGSDDPAVRTLAAFWQPRP